METMNKYKRLLSWIVFVGVFFGIGIQLNGADLIHRYSFDVDATATDAVGGEDGTLVSPATVTGGVLNTDPFLGGSVDFGTQLLPADGFTLSLWVNNNTGLLDSQTVISQAGFIITIDDGADSLILPDGSVAGAGTLTSGDWHHIVYVWPAEDLNNPVLQKLYLDGTLIGEYSFQSTILSDSGNTRFAANQGGSNTLSGMMDEVRIYNGAISPESVGVLFTGGRDGPLLPPVDCTQISIDCLLTPVILEPGDDGIVLLTDLSAYVSVTADCDYTLTYSTALGTPIAVGSENITVTATVDSDSSNSASCEVMVTVLNQAPQVTIDAPASGMAVMVGTPVDFLGSFFDDDEAGTQTAVWDFFGLNTDVMLDGTVIDYTVVDSFTFDQPEIFDFQLTVTDSMDESGMANTVLDDLPAYLVVYDPYAGFVTGGGWFMSPTGALMPGEDDFMSVEGKASFGFNSKYDMDTNLPKGQTQFSFKEGELKFHSLGYDWLVVIENKAIYKGSGLLNGDEGYGFMLTAIDGDVDDGDGVDHLIIKIWESDSETIVYSNDIEGDEYSTAIEKGNIKIHKPRYGSQAHN